MRSINQFSDFLKNRLYEPGVYLRNFTCDFPDGSADALKRVSLLALPFLGMIKPLGATLSVSLGSMRAVNHLSLMGQAVRESEGKAALTQFAQTTLAVISVATTLFNFQAGLLITSVTDGTASIAAGISHLKAGNREKAAESLLQGSSSLLYSAFIVTGTLEAMAASLLFQAAYCLYQAAHELKEGRYPEAVVKIAFACLHMKQVEQYLQMIERRNQLLKLEKFTQLFEKIQKGRDSVHLLDSSLQEEKEKVVLIDANNQEYDFGTHYHGTGKGLVKGMNLQFRATVVDGKNVKNLDFKVNHAFREKLQGLVVGMESLTQQETQDLLAITHSHADAISFKVVPFQFDDSSAMGEAYQVSLRGLGEVFIGASKDMPGIYDRVRVQIEENKSIYDVHEMLSFFNLDDALRQSSADDVERMKMGHLFRIFYPQEALQIERKEIFFEMPLDELRAEMIKRAPKMKQTLQLYLDKMETVEILPGRLRYALPDIAKMAHQAGARTLISTITGVQDSSEEACSRLISIMKMGLMATEVRIQNGLMQGGLSPVKDFRSGGSDSVYTQMLTQANFDDKMQLSDLHYRGDIKILFSLDALNSGTYQYHEVSSGSRNIDPGYFRWCSYLTRENLFNFINVEEWWFGQANEVMIKERVAPSFITGILVNSAQLKSRIVTQFRDEGFIQMVDGIETVFNKPLSQFVQVATELSEQLLN